MKKLQLLFAFLAHTQVSTNCYIIGNNNIIENDQHSVCVLLVIPAEGSICSQKLLGSFSASLV